MPTSNFIKEHPAETAGPLATALAALIAGLIDFDNPDTVIYLAIVLSFVPAVVTWIVDMRQEPDVNSSSSDDSVG